MQSNSPSKPPRPPPPRRRTLRLRSARASRRPEALSREEPRRPGKMALPSPREPEAQSATSVAKPDGEMVLPGFPDADSFVKVSLLLHLWGIESRPRSARSKPGTSRPPLSRPHAHCCGPRVGVERPPSQPGSLSLPLPGGDRTRTLRDAPLPRPSFSQPGPCSLRCGKPSQRRGKGFLVTPMSPTPRDFVPARA